MKIKTGLVGLGTALLLLFPYYKSLLLPSNLGIYSHGLPVTKLVGGLLVDLLVVAVLTSGLLVAIQHLPETGRRILEGLFAAIMLWSIADVTFQILSNWKFLGLWFTVREQCGIGLLLLSVILTCFFQRIARPGVRAVLVGTAAVSFSFLWIAPRLIGLALVNKPDETAAVVHPTVSTIKGSYQRIIWILFDELSYDQTFEHRAPDLELPNFDRLRSVGVSFGSLKPAGFYTDVIVPSLFLGRPFQKIRSTINGNLWYKDESLNRWMAFDPNATLFSVAHQNGWSTGVDGWYNPYCQMLASELNFCSWEPSISLADMPGASENQSIIANAAVLPRLFLAKVIKRGSVQEIGHIQEHREVLARGQALIRNDKIRFVFLHLPDPHPPGIYDRRQHVLRESGSYLDNLVLADDTLGILLREIDATPSASQTTVIISSDHSWRVGLWRSDRSWTAEEERASGGHFDDRPVLLVHFPGQNSGREVDSALPEMFEHDMIAGMLQGKINSPEDLLALIAQRGY